MNVLVWLVEGVWEAAVDAAARHAPPDARITLLHAADPALPDDVRGAFTGLLGRGHPDPSAALSALTRAAEEDLLAAAAARLARPATAVALPGPGERTVVAACAELGADLLIVARDGDPGHPGPHSLGHGTRFVVDHAPCAVLLVWPAV
ncbi:universal stress protein [Dactylosporangium sp. CA-092794]|uniref:universal stress protein n=1 Tax=Dactylosporangium sp. CA-092794 TaxID=3239929 RepID=UPI003D8F4696